MLRILIWCFLIINLASYAQGSHSEIMLIFRKHYNENNGQAIYDMYAPTMQQKVSSSVMKAIISDHRENYGFMHRFEPLEQKGTVISYLAHLEQGMFTVQMILNDYQQFLKLLLEPFDSGEPGKIWRNKTALKLPFRGEWYTYWGGDDKRSNYHVTSKPQRNAFDFLILDKNNRSFQRSGTRNEDYYAFGKPIYASCDALVYKVRTGVEDNRPSQINPLQPYGNHIVLKTSNHEYIVYAHLEKGSIVVKEGDQLKTGAYLGNCGNSGNSSEPHLHMHIQDGPNLLADTGVPCFFEELTANGILKRDYSPVRGDRVSAFDY